jgi:hypothetical protein
MVSGVTGRNGKHATRNVVLVVRIARGRLRYSQSMVVNLSSDQTGKSKHVRLRAALSLAKCQIGRTLESAPSAVEEAR